ncbi:hypothetical protein [Actinomycetospora atypica]|uniref:AbiEi antitoxin C-terminal domain-containing protein n=1 Tax=Actinomycetospora atypica TaxID=1290095 RepID=A0ABV9YVQ0_9PSEU
MVSLGQILGQGLTKDVVRANVAAQRWKPLFRGTYALVTGEPTPEMWRQAALLFVPGAALLSHATAAAVLGLRGGSSGGPVHVTVPYGSSARGCDGLVIHRSRAFAHIALQNAVPPVTSKVVTLIDLAVEAPDAREGMRVLTAGAAAARVDAARIVESLELRKPRRYAKALLAAAKLLLEGIGSVLEAEYAQRVELAHGLPVGRRQVHRRVEETNRYEDIEYDMPGGTLTVRLDGFISHANKRTARSDRARDNAAELEGRARLTFGYEEVHEAACHVTCLVARRLKQLRWDGEAVRCRACEHFEGL